jgi:homoserine kinase
MKKLVILSLMLVSVSAFSQSTKAVRAVVPESAQIKKAKKAADTKAATAEAPCADTKEDVLKKLEEKKQAQAKANKGFSLQGNTDTGCTIK